MIPFDTLAALVAGDLPPSEADEVEAHVLGCDACSSVADALAQVARGVARLVRAGGLRGILTAAAVERLRAERVPMREYHATPGQVVPCTIGTVERFNLLACEVDPGGARRVDLVILGPEGTPLERFEDVPVDLPTRTLWVIEAGDLLRQKPSIRLTYRVVGLDDHGSERTLGDYGLDHTGYAG